MQITANNNENTATISTQNAFPKFPFLFQIVLGLVCGGLTFLASFFQQLALIPLYLDTIFTSTASFFGLFSGLVSAIFYHALCIFLWKQNFTNFIWVLCSITLVFIIRLYIRKKTKIFPMDIINLIFLNAVIISIEGALIFTILHILVNYNEDSSVRTMYLMLVRSNISLFESALLPRIPVNILDKGLSIAGGYFSFIGIKKLCNMIIKQQKHDI